MKKTRMVTVVMIALAAVLLLSACGGTVPSVGGGNAQAALCQGVSGVRVAVAGLSNVSADTSVADLQAQVQKLDTLVEALRAANGVLQRPAINDLITQYGNFKQQVSAVANQETLGVAVDGLRQNVTAINVALDQATSALNCQ